MSIIAGAIGCNPKIISTPDDAHPTIDAVTANCPGYGAQSNLALCAEFINAGCTKAVDCVEDLSIEACLLEGMTVCISISSSIDPVTLYKGCLEGLKTTECAELLQGNVPAACEQAIEGE